MTIMRNQVYDILFPTTDTVRILAVLENNTVIVISLVKKDTLPYEISLTEFEDEIMQGNAHQNFAFPSAFVACPTEKQKKAAKSNWELIGGFVQDEPDCFNKKIRSRFIAAKSNETGLQRKQIQRLLYRYWAGGMTQYALYPNYDRRGNPGRPRVAADSGLLGRPVIYTSGNQRLSIGDIELAHIKNAIQKYYNKHTKYSYRYAYHKMLAENYTDSDTGLLAMAYPTETQFRYHAQKFLNPKMRAGSTVYNKDMRGIIGSSRSEANGPGDVYQIDATIADVYLVSQYDRTAIVGRPELYFVTDVFSRMIVGFYVCLESASWENARNALLHTFMNKVDLCKQYGVSIREDEWPCSGLPRTLVVDNGELVSRASNSIIEGLGITVKNAPAWRPDLKGIVESRFRLLNIDLKASLPGAVLPDFSQRGAVDYRLNATLNLKEFTKIIIHFILAHNQRPMSEHPQPLPDVLNAHVPAVPIALWNWGIANRTGILRQDTQENLAIALSQRGQAQVTSKGIKFHNLYFECATSERENWFSTARVKGGWKIDIAYHAQNMEQIYWLKSSSAFERCPRTADSLEQFTQLTLEEIDWMHKESAAQKAAYSDIALQQKLDHNAAITSIIEDAVSDKKLVSFSSAKMKAKPAEIRQNRKAERNRFESDAQPENAQLVQPGNPDSQPVMPSQNSFIVAIIFSP